MSTPIGFLVQGLVISAPDIALAGLGTYLVAKGGSFRRPIGIVVLAAYAVRVGGSFLGSNPPTFRLDQHDTWSFLFAGIAAVIGFWLARRHLVGTPKQ
jgi:hypothetical protein